MVSNCLMKSHHLISSFVGAVACLSLSSCGHIFTKSHTYHESETVIINGAKVGSSVKPMGGKGGFSFSAMIYMAGAATLDGPFIWRVIAEGAEDEHVSMVVHRVKVTTSETNRSEWYPTEHLGVVQPFKTFKREPGKVYANFQIPGKLKVFPREDGDITMLADVSVTSKTRTERKLVKFQMASNSTKDVEFINVPAEIVRGIGKDPREWKW